MAINTRNIKKQLKKRGINILRLLLLFGLSYVILFPIISKIPASFMLERNLFDPTVRWIPRHFTLDNYRLVIRHMNYFEALFNSLALTMIISLMQLISCTIVGYGFARFKSNSNINKFIFSLVIFTLIVPPQLILVPIYLNFRFFDLFGIMRNSINLLGSYWPFILLSITSTGYKNGLFIYIMRQFFKGMPRELEESAYIDGAGPIKAFFLVMLPGALPALVIVFLFAFVWQYNDYFFTQLFLDDVSLLPISLSRLALRVAMEISDAAEVSGQGITGQYASLVNNTGMLLFIAPLLIIYAFLQRYFIESVQRTGLVG